MANEIELKLALPQSAQRSFQRLALLKQAASRKTERLVNIYYDTPAFALRSRGAALRLRRQGRIWLQTVKCAGKSAGGLTSRPEWEGPYLGHFDFSAIDAAPVREWLDSKKVRSRIAPIFETNFLRTTWRFEVAPGATLLLMYDRGWIVAAGRHESISELEIEIAAGDVGHVFDLARRIAERLPLAPALLSKAERGYRLFKATPPAPVRAAPIALDPGMSPLTGFRAIALSCLEHLQHNHEGSASRDDPEFIHQMRVATRRLRAALRLFAPLLPPELSAALIEPLRSLMQYLGHARDLDVLLDEIASPVMRALPDEPRLAQLVGLITDRSFQARLQATHALREPAFGQLMLLAADLLHRPPFLPETPALSATTAQTEPPATLAGFATQRLRRLRRKVRQLANAASIENPPSLHALRIGIKRLRYALEFFAPLAHDKSLARILKRLSKLQEALGQINDLANAGLLLMDCAGEDPRLREAVTLIGGWHGQRHTQLLEAIPSGLKRVGKLKLPTLD